MSTAGRLDASDPSIPTQQLDQKQSVRFATTAALPACTASRAKVGKTLEANANGAFSADGITPVVGDDILVKDQASAVDNGIYEFLAIGVNNPGGSKWKIRRRADADENVEVKRNMTVWVAEGTINADSIWVLTNDSVDVDVTDQDFTKTWQGFLGNTLLMTVRQSFSFDDPSPVDFGPFLDLGDKVVMARIDVTTTFDDAASLLALGTVVQGATAILPTNAVGVGVAGTYSSEASLEIVVPDRLRLQINPGTSTQGAGEVLALISRP